MHGQLVRGDQGAAGFQVQVPDAVHILLIDQVDRRADGDVAGAGIADIDVVDGNAVQFIVGQAQRSPRLAAQVDLAAFAQLLDGQRGQATGAAEIEAAGKADIVGLQAHGLPFRTTAHQLIAGAAQCDAAASPVAFQAQAAVADVDRAGTEDAGAGQRNVAIIGDDGRVQVDAAAGAIRHAAGRIVGRQVDRATNGGDRCIDVDRLACLGSEARAAIDHVDGAVEGDAVRRLQDDVAAGIRNRAGADGGVERLVGKLVNALQLAVVAGHDFDIVGIEQPVAALAASRAGIDADAIDRQVTARRFHQAAIARHRAAARRNAAEHARSLVAPHDDLAAVAVLQRVGGDGGILADRHLARVGNRRVLALIVAAQQHRAATESAAGVHAGIALHADLVAQHGNLAPLAHRTGGAGDAAIFQQRLAAGFQHDLAVLAYHCAVGVEYATLAQQRAGHADTPALRHHLADVDGLVGGRGQHHAQVRVGGVGQLHAVAGGQQHVAVRRREDAAVFHVRRDQQDLPAAADVDGALVDDGAGRVASLEAHLAGQEVLVRQRQAGGHQPRHIDARIAAEQHAVRIDQEYFTVRLQGSEDLAGVLAGDAVQYAAAGVSLDKARDLTGIHGKTLPVDDGIGRIGDGKQVALLVERGLAMHHLRRDRIGMGGIETGGDQQRQRGTAQRRLEGVAGGHGAQWFLFGHDVLSLVP